MKVEEVKHGMKVKIVSGFYEGSIGWVQYRYEYLFFKKFTVLMHNGVVEEFYADELETLK